MIKTRIPIIKSLAIAALPLTMASCSIFKPDCGCEAKNERIRTFPEINDSFTRESNSELLFAAQNTDSFELTNCN